MRHGLAGAGLRRAATTNPRAAHRTGAAAGLLAARGLAIAALLALVPLVASAQEKRLAIRFGLRTGYSISQQVCYECGNENHPDGWLEGVDFGLDIGERWQVRTQALITALGGEIFEPGRFTDESHKTYRNQWTLQLLGHGPGRHRSYAFAGGGLGAYSSYDQYPTTTPAYPTDVSASGFSLAVGIGYDWRVRRWLTVQPEAAYHYSWIGELDLNSYRSVPGRDTMGQLAISVGFAYRTPGF